MKSATPQNIRKTQSEPQLETKYNAPSFEQIAPVGIPHLNNTRLLRQPVEVDSPPSSCSCSTCPSNKLNLCAAALRMAGSEPDRHPGASLPKPVLQTVPARRIVCHPKDWSEFVTIICNGWAASSIILADGRRQILSFLLPGDLISTASLFGSMSGRTVEAITAVTYRKFKRNDIKAALFKDPDLIDGLSKTLIEEKEQADQLALDLGRRMADERIARQILYLADRLTKRGMMQGQTMQFPLRQRHIADATGLTPVHVSKVLSEFQRAGLIDIASRSLTITNAAELRQIGDWR